MTTTESAMVFAYPKNGKYHRRMEGGLTSDGVPYTACGVWTKYMTERPIDSVDPADLCRKCYREAL